MMMVGVMEKQQVTVIEVLSRRKCHQAITSRRAATMTTANVDTAQTAVELTRNASDSRTIGLKLAVY